MLCPNNDRLTGLLTREAFHERARKITAGGLAVVWFNLDNFKMFNKRFGFERGDDILKEIALILGSTFSQDSLNLLARFSDDNFVVLTDWATVEMNIDTVQEYLYSLHENVTLRLRAGIYFPSENDDIRSSCDRAKLACDSIRKNHSVSSCMFHDGMSRELALQQYILDTLDTAILRE
ncbi:MAG: diguanylate cyclase, partial [Synergistaceae bacterium]|nr:diguanylate cyclase [Synergistaceae bacterium]